MGAAQRDDDDITTVVDAAEAILLVENAPLALAVILPNGRVALANRAFREYLGYEAGEMAGAAAVSFVAPGHVQALREQWCDLLANGVSLEHSIELRCRNGDCVPARVSSVVVADDDGTPRFVLTRALAA